MNRSMPGLPVHHQLPEFTQTHVHGVGDTIQPSHPLSSPSPPAPNPSQHQGLFQWVNSSNEVAKVFEFQLHGSQRGLAQWNYEPCHVGPPKTDGSWWRVLERSGMLRHAPEKCHRQSSGGWLNFQRPTPCSLVQSGTDTEPLDKHSPVDCCLAVSCSFGVLIGEDEHMSFYSTILELCYVM